MTPFGDSKRKRGRPSPINEHALCNLRNQLHFVLEQYWAEVGWELQHAKTLSDARNALRPITGVYCPPLEKFTREVKRTMRTDYQRAIQSAEAVGKRVATCNRSIPDLQTRRDRAHAAASQATDPATADEMRALEQSLEVTLAQAYEALKAESAAYYSLRDDLAAHEAYLAQSDLLDFIRDARYSKSPTTFANAMAALPLIGWRQSSTRSKKDCPPVPHGLTYEMFTIVCNCFAESVGTADLAIELVRAILTDPRQNNSGIKEFRSNWYFLKNAIRTAFKKHCEWGAMPYQVFGDYQRSTKSIGPVDAIRAEEDQLRI